MGNFAMGARGCFLEGRAEGAWSWRLQYNAEVKNDGAIPPLPGRGKTRESKRCNGKRWLQKGKGQIFGGLETSKMSWGGKEWRIFEDVKSRRLDGTWFPEAILSLKHLAFMNTYTGQAVENNRQGMVLHLRNWLQIQHVTEFYITNVTCSLGQYLWLWSWPSSSIKGRKFLMKQIK